MRIAISGSSGLIGSAHTPQMRERGDEGVHLVPRTVGESPGDCATLSVAGKNIKHAKIKLVIP